MDLTSNFHSSRRLSPKQFVCVCFLWAQYTTPACRAVFFCTLKAFYAGVVTNKRQENAKCLDVECLDEKFSGSEFIPSYKVWIQKEAPQRRPETSLLLALDVFKDGSLFYRC